MNSVSRDIMEESLHKLMSERYSNCLGATEGDGYIAFYHERGLYSVEHINSGIVILVYASSPFKAIELIEEFRKGGAIKEGD